MRDILGKIFATFGALLFTALIIGLAVIPHPTEWISYLLLSMILVVDGMVIYIILPYRQKKDKPKTVSIQLVCWLSGVSYCCVFAAICLLFDAYFTTKAVIALVFGCIFGFIGLSAIIGLIYQFVIYLNIGCCLKYGKETVAEFVSFGKSARFEYGDIKRNNYSSITRFSVCFEFRKGKKKVTAESRRVFSYDEVRTLQAMHTFKIKYNKHTAVINEIVKTANN